MKRPDSGLVALTVGMLGSGAANVVWAWPDLVHVAAGLFATALVPTSLHLWTRVPVIGTWSRVIRAAVMTYICMAAAAVNLTHAAWLLLDYRPTANVVVESRLVTLPDTGWLDVLTVILLITAVEGVMVMASLARRGKPDTEASRAVVEHPQARVARRPRTELPQQSTPPAAAAAPTPTAKSPDELAEARRAKEREKKRRQREAQRARQAEAADA